MTYRQRTKMVCASILMIIKNATIIIPVIEGIIYSLIDLIHPEKTSDDVKDVDVKQKENEEESPVVYRD